MVRGYRFVVLMMLLGTGLSVCREAATAAGAPPRQQAPESLRELVAGLGDAHWFRRESAHRELLDVGMPAVPYLEQDGSLSLEDFRGQVVVVNFWASWCVACREEHPALTAASAAYREAGVEFIGVVYQDRTPNAVGFLDEMGRGEDFRYVTDPESRLAIDFGVFGVPETFFIDETGKIAAKITGASTLPLLSGVLDEMLAGRTPAPSTNTGPVQEAPDQQ